MPLLRIVYTVTEAKSIVVEAPSVEAWQEAYRKGIEWPNTRVEQEWVVDDDLDVDSCEVFAVPHWDEPNKYAEIRYVKKEGV